MNIPTQNPLVIVAIGLGAFWLLTQRKANAATYAPAQAKQDPTTMAYLRSPSTASQYAAYGAGRIGVAAQPSTVSQGLSLASQVLSMFKPTESAGIATGYNPGTLGTGRSAEYDLNSGEAQAREYYSTHADQFIAGPVVITQAMQDAAMREGMSEY